MHAAYIRAVYVGAIGRENVRVTDFSIDRLLYRWLSSSRCSICGRDMVRGGVGMGVG